MRCPPKPWITAVLVLGCLWAPSVAAPPQTVCTITVNSADEKEAFRRHLPGAGYRLVELVERGRPDWLASACRADISCDLLIVSGHFDGSNQFFSDQLQVREYLPVDELERVSCSDSCPGLFSRLKEVHLYGCNTLNPQPLGNDSGEIVRGLARAGRSPKEAERERGASSAGPGESSRDRMRQVFKGVPVIYGFSASAPLGPVAGSVLSSYFRSVGLRELGQGRPGSRLLQHFAPYAMTATAGVRDRDPLAAGRRDICRFADDRLSAAAKLDFMHQLLQRPVTQAMIHLDRIQRLAARLDPADRQQAQVAQALAAIRSDGAARERLLGAARAAGQPSLRLRMLDVARDLGWLSDEQRWLELALMLGELQARQTLGLSEVDLACSLNRAGDLDGAYRRGAKPGDAAGDAAHAALRACLGSDEGRARTLAALVSRDEAEVQIAGAYLRHRPILDAAELRRIATRIAEMPASEAQVRALEALGRHYVSDREIIELLVRLYADSPSWPVQTAVAGILMRADPQALASPQLRATLLESRRPAPSAGDTMVDALIRRLQAP